MRVTAIRTQTERKPQDRSARRAEKRGRRARMTPFRGFIRPIPGVSATAVAARGEKHLVIRAKSGNFAVKRQAIWGMSD